MCNFSFLFFCMLLRSYGDFFRTKRGQEEKHPSLYSKPSKQVASSEPTQITDFRRGFDALIFLLYANCREQLIVKRESLEAKRAQRPAGVSALTSSSRMSSSPSDLLKLDLGSSINHVIQALLASASETKKVCQTGY